MLHGGDGVFDSGLVLKVGFTALRGLGVEFTVSTRISRPKWQTLRLGLAGSPTVVQSGVSSRMACGLRLPTGEGETRLKEYSVGANGEVHVGQPSPHMVSGAWYRVRMQIFPDGTCGFALDERPIWRSTKAQDPTLRYHPYIHGQTVGTRILVRSVEMWQGVKTDLDWASLERPSPPSAKE
jgi:hypothetical protein